MPHFPGRTGAAALALTALLGAGCAAGGEDPDPTTTAPTTSAPATTSAPTTTTREPPDTSWPGSVLDLLVVEDTPRTGGYDRDDWGGGWSDDDGDCLNTRHEVLMAEATASPVLRNDGCLVTGGQWLAAFTGSTVDDPRALDIDHLVPLANAHRSGGWAWDGATKRRYANDQADPRHLMAVTASANRSKGDRGPEAWRPPDRSYWCTYADTWADIKVRWALTVTSAELAALHQMLETCQGDPQPMVVALPEITLGDPIDLDGTTDGGPPPNPGDVRNCGDFDSYPEAKAWFDRFFTAYGDVARLDGDGDGEPCESLPGGP